jgi:hypothetical protein
MANAMTPGVLGAFVHVDAATDAIRALRANGHTDLTVYNAAPNHEIEEALEHKVSPVRMFTLVGGLTGCAAGFAMTIWMSLDWPLLVGGKPFDSVPPYTVLAFELTILFGALFTVAGMMILSFLKPTTKLMYDEKFTDDQIGIFVPCAPGAAGGVEEVMKRAGSVEVRHAS